MKPTTAPKLQKTTKYDIFLKNPLQREFRPQKVQRLIAKMKRNGFPPSLAISVYSNGDGKYVINTGHHRLAAARELGLPVHFVVEHQWDIFELSDEGDEATAWLVKDHVANHAKSGNKDFQEIVRLSNMGLHPSLASSMLQGESAGSGNARRLLKGGTFKIKTMDHVNKWIALHEEFGDRVPCIYHRIFIQAWSKCLFTPDFDNGVFEKKLRINPNMLDRCSTEMQMLELIQDLYNHKSQNKIPLAFLVTENSKTRRSNFGKA